MRTTRLQPRTNLLRRALSLTGEAARESRALSRGAKRMPNPMPWDWAAPRLLPILSGPSFDRPGESLVRARSELGPMVQFGVDLGGAYAFVDETVGQRWECTAEQLMERALTNLTKRARNLPEKEVATGVMCGRSIRLLRDRPRWAGSLVLVPDQLFRLFGDHDQVIGTPTPSILVSLPIDTPPHTIADVIVDFEHGTIHALWLDPFVVEDGRLIWSDDHEDEEDDPR
jgi:hypothetical protein